MKKSELLQLLKVVEKELKGYKITLKSETARHISVYFGDSLDPNAGASLKWYGDTFHVDKYLINPYKSKDVVYIPNLTPSKEALVYNWIVKFIDSKR